MAVSTAMSVASYSVVLAETFATVGLSTLVPATFVGVARAIKAAGEARDASRPVPAGTSEMERLDVGSIVPTGPAEELVRYIAANEETLDLLVPKKARIQAEFEMQASESYSEGMSGGVTMDVVTVKAGMSLLYKTKSECKVKLDLNFALANFLLEEEA